MKRLTYFRLFLRYFGFFKVAMIGFVRPKLMRLDDTHAVVKIPLTRRTKNHLNSMYFGALAVGADLAGGLHGFYHADKEGVKISLAFKSFQADFIKRPEDAVYFVSEMGNEVQCMLRDSKSSGSRKTLPIDIKAYVNYEDNPTEVARFTLQLSIKVIGTAGRGHKSSKHGK